MTEKKKSKKNTTPVLSTRKKEVFLTVLSNLTLQIITAVCGFILPPLIIRTFGSSVNGMVSSITQFIAYLNLVEAGVGAASIAALYKPLAAKDTDKQNQILSATVTFYNRSGCLFTFLVLVLAAVYPLIIGSQVDRLTSALMVLVLGITGSAEFFLIGKYRVLLTADKKIYVISFIQSAAVIINTIVAVILIKCGCGIVVVKLSSALVYLSRFIVLAVYVHKKYSELSFHAEPDTKAISQSKNALIHQIGGFVVFNSPVVIITVFCSLKDASIYAVYAMVFSAVNSLLSAFSNGMQSFFGESLTTDSLEHTRKIFGRYETLFFLIEGWFYSMTCLLIMPFMEIYTREMTDAEYIQPLVAFLFVVIGILNNLRNPAGQVINAAGHFKKTQWHSIAEVIINIVCSILFTVKFGFIGVLIGSVCSHLFRAFDVIIYTNMKILKKSSFLSFGKAVMIFVLCSIMSFFAFRLFGTVCDSFVSWILLAVKSGVIVAIPLVIVLYFVYRGSLKNV